MMNWSCTIHKQAQVTAERASISTDIIIIIIEWIALCVSRENYWGAELGS